ncbi:sporulation kinase [Bacillus cereus]|nr:sporulation kinase [Bacillus cereus]
MLGKPKSTNYEWCNIGENLLYVVQLMESYAAQYRGKPHLQVDGNVSVINGDDKQ